MAAQRALNHSTDVPSEQTDQERSQLGLPVVCVEIAAFFDDCHTHAQRNEPRSARILVRLCEASSGMLPRLGVALALSRRRADALLAGRRSVLLGD